MTRLFPRNVLLAAVTVMSVTGQVHAQVSCSSCAPPPIVQCIQPQPCYTTVPVTEMRECRQIVQKPVVETKYVDQQVTTYEPVVEDRQTEIPTVTYQDVTECRQETRDCGRWVTQYQPRQKLHPCQYDNRPDFFGFMNRVGYSIGSAFTPNYSVKSAYVPSYQTVNVPYTRRVAVHGTRKVNYRVTRMVPRTTTQKVAVNTVRMVNEEVVTRTPVTVYRTVPFGSTVTTYAPSTSTATAAAPQPDPISREARRPPEPGTRSDSQAVPKREQREENYNFDHEQKSSQDFHREHTTVIPARRTAMTKKVPAFRSPKKQDFRMAGFRPAESTPTTATRVGQWIARRTPSVPQRRVIQPRLPQGPSFPEQVVAYNAE